MLRSAGEVGCAHCTKLEADRACQVCTRLVCAACAADWATCAEPSGRVVRLGLTARVRDVDPNGRIALISHWRQPLRLFDLRSLRWLPDRLPRGIYLMARAFPPRLTTDGRLLYAEMIAATENMRFGGITERILATGYEHTVLRGMDNMPSGGTAVSSVGDRYYYVSESQRVVVIARRQVSPPPPAAQLVGFGDRAAMLDGATELQAPVSPGADVHMFEPLPRKVIQAAALESTADRELLGSGSWSELALHRIVDGKLERLDHITTDLQGDVAWLAIAGGWYVAAVRRPGGGVRFQLHRLTDKLALGTPARLIVPSAPFRTAALSRDGRHLAIATDNDLTVYDLDTETETTFTEHTDSINYVRFSADDHVLISADTDNRLILRPRTQAGYARALLPVHLE